MKFHKKDRPVIIESYDRRRRGSHFGSFDLPDKYDDNPTIAFFNKFSLVFQGVLSCLLVFFIEWISRHSLTSAVGFVVHSPLTYLYNVLLIFTSFLIVYVFQRRFLIRTVLTIFWLLLGIVNGVILASRVTPFNFTDLKLINDLLNMKNSKYVSAGQAVLIIVAFVVVIAFILFLIWKGPKYQRRVHRIRNLILVVLSVIAIPFVTKAAIHTDILAGYFGNLAQGYKDYGFVYSFTASVVDTGMSKPVDYSNEKIKKINKKVSVSETSLNQEDMPNIIFVQLETFIDPYELNFLKYSEDPIPNFHKLMKNYTSGYLTVPVVGAGTANTEFEVLTGMGIQFFGLGEYPYKTVLKNRSCESAADDLKQIGYSTHALHNNGGNFYGRANIFSQMGFDTFTSKELMNITSYNEIGTWPTDDILVSETTKTLDSTPNQSDFIYTISVQSHGSYPTYKVFDDPAIKVTGGETTEQHYQWEYYINELHEVDEFVGNLVDELSKRKEKTILVLYGDHLPTMGLEDKDMKNGNIFQTTYTTWNNFGLEKKDKDVHSYQLMSYITNQLGIHEGTIFRYHQSAMNKKQTDRNSYYSNWKLLQYDLLYGNRYSYDETDKYPASYMLMGVETTRIRKLELSVDEKTLLVYGNGFTPWSKVYIDDKKLATHYISGECVEVALSDVPDGSLLRVSQVGSSNTRFRTTNAYKFELPKSLRGKEIEKTEVHDTVQEDFSTVNAVNAENSKSK